jgi:uncharacterized protein YihD (DUF1040 family)
MRDPNRIDKILSGIKKVWEKYPDLRLGQLLCNVMRDPALYYVEDEDLVSYLEQYYLANGDGSTLIKKDGQ